MGGLQVVSICAACIHDEAFRIHRVNGDIHSIQLSDGSSEVLLKIKRWTIDHCKIIRSRSKTFFNRSLNQIEILLARPDWKSAANVNDSDRALHRMVR